MNVIQEVGIFDADDIEAGRPTRGGLPYRVAVDGEAGRMTLHYSAATAERLIAAIRKSVAAEVAG